MLDNCPECGSRGTFKASEAVGFKECEECGYWEEKDRDVASVIDQEIDEAFGFGDD